MSAENNLEIAFFYSEISPFIMEIRVSMRMFEISMSSLSVQHKLLRKFPIFPIMENYCSILYFRLITFAV